MELYNDASAWARVKSSMKGEGPWYKQRAPIPKLTFVNGWTSEMKAKLQHHETPRQPMRE